MIACVTSSIYYDLNVPIYGIACNANDMCILEVTMDNEILGNTHKLYSYRRLTSIFIS